MLPLNEALIKWADELMHYQSPGWNSLPDIDLYMDQVITYLERQLSIYSQTGEDKMITPAMINNYVKSEVIPRPVQKKYTKDHLIYLLTVLNLKQILSLSDITRLIAYETNTASIEELLGNFNAIQHEAIGNTSERMRDALKELDGNPSSEDAEKRLSHMALKLSLEANANRIVAKRILDEITARKVKVLEDLEKEKDREKSKEKDKSKEKEKEKNRKAENE